jgi:hypothetical protein
MSTRKRVKKLVAKPETNISTTPEPKFTAPSTPKPHNRVDLMAYVNAGEGIKAEKPLPIMDKKITILPDTVKSVSREWDVISKMQLPGGIEISNIHLQDEKAGFMQITLVTQNGHVAALNTQLIEA